MDERAFEALFRAHYAALAGFAARYVRDAALAEELVQDLFTDLWARRANWHPRPGSERAYLLAATRNRALNLRKRHAIERDWEHEEAAPDVRELHPRPARADRPATSGASASPGSGTRGGPIRRRSSRSTP